MTDSTTRNIQVLRTALTAMQDGDLDRCVPHLTEDLLINLAGLPRMRGRDVWRQGAEVMLQAFPDATFTVHDVVAQHDRVAVRVTIRGTHRGEFLGIAGTGRVVEYVSHEFSRFVDGRVAEEWICSDMSSLHGQLTGDA